jgi:hypothetical protein
MEDFTPTNLMMNTESVEAFFLAAVGAAFKTDRPSYKHIQFVR